MKYRTPPTLPSFLPSGSSSSTPTHWPLANSVVPQNRSVPVWGDKDDTAWTGALETMVGYGQTDIMAGWVQGPRFKSQLSPSLAMWLRRSLYA